MDRANWFLLGIACVVWFLFGFTTAIWVAKKPPLMPCYKAETIYDLRGVPFKGTFGLQEEGEYISLRGHQR